MDKRGVGLASNCICCCWWWYYHPVNLLLVGRYFGSQPDRATSSSVLYAQSYTPAKGSQRTAHSPAATANALVSTLSSRENGGRITSTMTVLVEVLLRVSALLYYTTAVPSLATTFPRSTNVNLTYPSKTRAALSEQPGLSKCTDQGEANRPVRLPDAYLHPRLINHPSICLTIPSQTRRQYQIDPSTGHHRPVPSCHRLQ
jgi:hypothetical protein